MSKNYAALPYDYLEEMDALNDAEFGRLTRALLVYSMTGEPIALCGNERFYTKRVMAQEDSFKAACEEISAARSEAGKAGANARWQNGKAVVANGKNGKAMFANGKNDTERKEEGFPPCPPSSSPPVTPVSPTPYNPPSQEEKERVLRAKRFTPPTLAEVQSYVAERHSAVDPQEFIDFYTSKGWMVGKTPMKDWKAACRNAEKWDRWRGITPREEDRYGRYTGYSGQNQSTPRRIPGELVLE